MSLTVRKQKEFEAAQKLDMELVDVHGSGSAVLRLADAGKVKAAQEGSDERVLKALQAAGEKGASAKDITAKTGMNPHTVKTALQRLKRAVRAELRKRRWYALPEPKLPPGIEAELQV